MGRWLALLVLGAALAPAISRANVFDQFGFEPRGVAMGGAQAAAAEDYVAAYFNPSLLVLQKEFTFGLGMSLAQPVMDVHSQSVADAPRLRLPGNPPDFGGLTLGLLFPLAGKVHNRVAIGLSLYLPSNNVLRTEGVDPTMPNWYFYQSNPDRLVVAVSAGVRITDWMLVGAGAQVLGQLNGGLDFKVNLFDKTFEHRSLKTDLASRAAPLAGMTLNLEKLGTRVAFSYRAPIWLDYSLPTSFDMGDLGKVAISIDGIVHYSPHTFTLAGQYKLGQVTASAEARYQLWSLAPNPATLVGMDVSSDVLHSLGIDDQFDMQSVNGPIGFEDTLSVHLGGEYRIVERFAVRAGYSFRPTPVPLQTGDTNLLDGDTHSASIGLGFSFDDPLEVFSKPVHIELAAQRLFIPERRADKAKDDVVPSYAYSGAVNHLALAVRYLF